MRMHEPSWGRHYQRVWVERAGDPGLPLWLRVASLAYGKHLKNGHAVFRPGEIKKHMTTVNLNTGVLHEPTRQAVSAAIVSAVEHGFLDRTSRTVCLVVPAHAIVGGIGGTETSACPVHQP